jgi:hypothetical protein
LNITDQSHPPDWRITYYTQIFANYSARWQAQIFKIRRNLNTTADTLARQAFSASVPTSSTHEPACSYSNHGHQCSLVDALTYVSLQSVTLLSPSCCWNKVVWWKKKLSVPLYPDEPLRPAVMRCPLCTLRGPCPVAHPPRQ